jgi:hypothetical protein
MAKRSRYSYCTTAALWRELAYLRANRQGLEEFSAAINSSPPFDYHQQRREILKTLSARSARKAA